MVITNFYYRDVTQVIDPLQSPEKLIPNLLSVANSKNMIFCTHNFFLKFFDLNLFLIDFMETGICLEILCLIGEILLLNLVSRI
jgi:hypothetical protein